MGVVVVTGVGPRTGTSYIMQQAKKAGLPIAGKKFLDGWTVEEHNREGYWELDPSEPLVLSDIDGKVVKLWNHNLQSFPLDSINRIVVLERRDKDKQLKSIDKVMSDEKYLKYASQSLCSDDPNIILKESIKGMGMWLLQLNTKDIRHVYTESINKELPNIIDFLKGGLQWV